MMKWKRKSVVRYFEPMEARELMESLAVEDDDPLLRAVVHVLHKNSLELGAQSGALELDAAASKGLAMSACAVEDACDELLRLVERARAVRSGQEREE